MLNGIPGEEIVKLGGLSGLLMVLVYIARLMRSDHVRRAAADSGFQLFQAEIERQNRVIAEMGQKIDDMRAECAGEIRERDQRILALEREVSDLKARLEERSHMDELGRQGKIERRRPRLEAGNEAA